MGEERSGESDRESVPEDQSEGEAVNGPDVRQFESPYSERSEYSITPEHAECPHCHHVWYPDDWYPSDHDELETECPKCEKPLMLFASYRVNIYACPEIVTGQPEPDHLGGDELKLSQDELEAGDESSRVWLAKKGLEPRVRHAQSANPPFELSDIEDESPSPCDPDETGEAE